jgi:long-chain acyl-CoA synthetase
VNIGHWLARQATAGPLRPALFLGRELVADYGQFHDYAARVAGWLVAQGVRPGDRVALVMGNCPDYLIALYAIWYAGAVAVPVNAKLHPQEVGFIVGDAGARLTFCATGLTGQGYRLTDIAGAEYRAALAHDPISAPVGRAPDDLAWLFYTSGTTGRPKGVQITHRMLIAMSLAYLADVDAVSPEDSTLYAAPMSHGAGLYNMVHVRMGARHVLPVSGGFDADEIFDLSRHFGRVQMFAAPTMVRRMTEVAKSTDQRGKGLNSIIYAGGPMYQADIIAAVAQFGPVFIQIYGQGECPMGITALSRRDVADRDHPRWCQRLASVGRAQSGVEVRIADDKGGHAHPGTAGEILVRGDVVMPGYWRNDAASAETLSEGWLRTGDIGSMDADGYVTLMDRSKDMIISGGSNIYPREVEEVLLTHPKVRAVAVVSRPHPDWGEEVVAFVVGQAPPEDLDKLCLENIARFKRPRDYVYVDDLPQNNYGKILKTDLRARLKNTT